MDQRCSVLGPPSRRPSSLCPCRPPFGCGRRSPQTILTRSFRSSFPSTQHEADKKPAVRRPSENKGKFSVPDYYFWCRPLLCVSPSSLHYPSLPPPLFTFGGRQAGGIVTRVCRRVDEREWASLSLSISNISAFSLALAAIVRPALKEEERTSHRITRMLWI